MNRPWLAVLAISLLALGCGTTPPNGSPLNATDTQSNSTLDSHVGNGMKGNAQLAQPDNGADSQLEVNLELTDIDAFNKYLLAQKGRVVLVDYWATWCTPCVKKFPETVRLFQKYHASDLEVVSVSLDSPEDAASVIGFLKRNKADFTNFLHRESEGRTGFDEHKIDGGIPFFTLYDRSGKLRYRFSLEPEEIENCESAEHIDVRIRELLAE